MSPAQLHLLADDLTGALDSAAAFGAGVPVAIDRPAMAASEHPVAAVATATRDLPTQGLPRALAPVLDWLRSAPVAFKKVDSLLRGNTFAEVGWLARAGGFRRVVFAPAYPAQGRYTVEGQAWIAPPGAPSSQGRAFVEGLLIDRLEHACAAWGDHDVVEWQVPDVQTQDDLDRLVHSVADPSGPVLWCGSAGLAQAWARVLGPVPDPVGADRAGSGGGLPDTGARWVVGASHHPVSRAQWLRAYERHPGARRLDGETLLRWAQRAAGEVATPVTGADRLLIDLALPGQVGAGEAAEQLARQTRALARLPRPAGLAVLGGDTLRALLTASGGHSLVTGISRRPGWGRARWCGGPWDGLMVDTRSGAFGDDNDLAELIALDNPG